MSSLVAVSSIQCRAWRWAGTVTVLISSATLSSRTSGPPRAGKEVRALRSLCMMLSATCRASWPPPRQAVSTSWGHCDAMSIMPSAACLQDFMASYKAGSEYFLGAIVTTRSGDGLNEPLQVQPLLGKAPPTK